MMVEVTQLNSYYGDLTGIYRASLIWIPSSGVYLIYNFIPLF
jgi:hypothetical protein